MAEIVNTFFFIPQLCLMFFFSFNSGIQSIITYATVHGYMCGWDLRQPKEKYAWKFQNDRKLGVPL